MRGLVLLALVGGCHHRGGAQAGGFAVPLTADAPKGDAPADEVVATVDGRPIRASAVALQAQARGESAKAALAELVDAEVLAGEAARRGLDRDPGALEAARAAAVRRLLAVTFEKDVTPAAVPMRELRNAYQRNINMLDHSEYVDVWHILVPVAKTAAPDERAAARAAAAELARRARGIGSADAFKALAEAVEPPGAPFKVERIVTARDGWVLKSFSFPAFELQKPGETSPVVETDYGYHVIYLNQRIPPLHLTVEEAAPRLLPSLFPDFQRREFAKFIDGELARHQVTVRYDRIP